LGIFLFQLQHSFGNVFFSFPSSSAEESSLPLFMDSKDPPVPLTVRTSMTLYSWLQPSLYTIRADDCLKELRVNDMVVPSSLIGPCIIDRPIDLRLKEYMQVGKNDIVAIIADSGGRQGISITASQTDPLVLFVKIVVLFFFVLLGALIGIRLRDPWRNAYLCVILLGIVLRCIYFDVTPFDVRVNDVDGHIEYILYIVKHWTVPNAHEGWQFYQPPLYYFLMAIPYRLAQFFGQQHFVILRFLQMTSFAFALGVLAIVAWLSHLVFSREQRIERLLMIAIIACVPGMIFFSSRINNDVLLQFLSFLTLTLTVAFWQKPSAWTWSAIIVTLIAGLLTKMSIVPILASVAIVFCVHPDFSWKKKCMYGLIGVCTILATTEWLFVLRAFQDSGLPIVGNIGSLNGDLIVRNSLIHYITFNPFEVLRHPYNHAWNDVMRRSFFFEYLYRSVFFGEFYWGHTLRTTARVVLALGFGGLLLVAIGYVNGRIEQWRKAFPMWIFFAVVLVAHIAFRAVYPYAPSQDFRYSSVLIVPVAYFMLLGLAKFPPILRKYGYVYIGTWIVSCAIFLVSLSLINPR
jgi:hypothetical protein